MPTLKDLQKKKADLQEEIKQLQKNLAGAREKNKFSLRCERELQRRIANNRNKPLRFYGNWAIFAEGNHYKNDEDRIQEVKNRIQNTTSSEVWILLKEILFLYYEVLPKKRPSRD